LCSFVKENNSGLVAVAWGSVEPGAFHDTVSQRNRAH